jgi:hypothetical protein
MDSRSKHVDKYRSIYSWNNMKHYNKRCVSLAFSYMWIVWVNNTMFSLCGLSVSAVVQELPITWQVHGCLLLPACFLLTLRRFGVRRRLFHLLQCFQINPLWVWPKVQTICWPLKLCFTFFCETKNRLYFFCWPFCLWSVHMRGYCYCSCSWLNPLVPRRYLCTGQLWSILL